MASAVQDAGWTSRGALNLDASGEPEHAKQSDAEIVHVDLIPGHAVARRDRVGVVVVVPAFTAGEQSDPPVVAGVVAGVEAAGAPHVGGRIDEPGYVQAKGDAQQ